MRPQLLRRQLLAAPHRLGFLAGAALLLLCFIWWGATLLARWQGAVLPSAVVPMFLHGYSMTYNFFPLFMLGFIYTAGPRWLGVASPKWQRYAPIMLGYALGCILVISSAINTYLLVLGTLLQTVAWLAALAVWLRAIQLSQVGDKLHAKVIATAFALGAIGLLLALYWSLTQDTAAWSWSIQLGLWGLLLPVFITVSHRMIPFFSSNALQPYTAWRPQWLLYTLLGCSFVKMILLGLAMNTLLVDAAMAGLLLYTSWRWCLLKSFKVRLLAMLHAAFAWAGVALLLSAISSAMQLAGGTGLGFAPLHALSLGFFCTMLLGFVTRVTLGHSGRPLLAGGVAWVCYWTLHGVALARVLGELIPSWQNALYALAAVAACVALLLWSREYAPLYWQARADGQAG